MSAVLTYAQANPAQRSLRRFAATRPGDWLFATVLRRLDGPVYRFSGGRHTAANLLSGLPVVHLTTTGARTGLARTVPVLGLPTPDGLAVIASNFGRRRQPGWYHNLRAHPEAEVTVDGVTSAVRAVEATGAVRDRIWCAGLAVFPGWSAYERRAGGRDIAVFVLTTPG
jgi:deazaflavin-dependent oxidoreductase (nitroreductase family)